MKEIWKPINPILDIEDCYEVSSLGRIRNTRYNKIQDDIHHSTNGFDYIFIATKEHKPSYQHIDLIVCSTFHQCNESGIEKGKPVIPHHIDGNLRNNHADNLEFVEDEEIWKDIVYRDIKPGRYMISNHGRVFDLELGRLKSVSCNGKYYPGCRFMTTRDITAKYDLHRIVATMFTPGYDKDHKIVNHVDNSYDNHWRNLEWCTFGWNNVHAAYIYGNRSRLSIDELDVIRDKLIEFKSPKIVYNMLRDLYLNITIGMIDDIKNANDCYNKSWKYTQADLKSFMENTRVHKMAILHSDEDLEHFCQVIVECNGDINKAHNILKEEGYVMERNVLYNLKHKKYHPSIVCKYF